jgi:exodeoxyribonuclease VII small subunit
MKSELTYSQAFAALETLVAALEEGGVELEELATKIKQANGLIDICEAKLRKIDSEAEEAAKAVNKQQDK